MNEALAGINVVTYDYLTDSLTHLNLPYGNHIGVLAQNIYEVFPELTQSIDILDTPNSDEAHSDEEYLGVRYREFIPILIAAYKERSQLINDQQTRINEIHSQIEELNLLLDGI